MRDVTDDSGMAMPPKLDDKSDTERVQIVAPASWVDRVEAWRRKQPRIPSRSEAIRMLVDRALEEEAGPDPLRQASASNATPAPKAKAATAAPKSLDAPKASAAEVPLGPPKFTPRLKKR